MTGHKGLGIGFIKAGRMNTGHIRDGDMIFNRQRGGMYSGIDRQLGKTNGHGAP